MLAIFNMVFTGILTLGTGSSAGIVFFATENGVDRREIIWTNTLLMLATSTVFMMLIFPLAPNISVPLLQRPDCGDLVILSSISMACGIVTMPVQSYLRMVRKAKVFVLLTVIANFLTLALCVYAVVFMGRGIRGILESGAIASFLMMFVTMILVGRNFAFRVKWHWIPS